MGSNPTLSGACPGTYDLLDPHSGEVLERPNRRDWKSRVPLMRDRGFESHPLRRVPRLGSYLRAMLSRQNQALGL